MAAAALAVQLVVPFLVAFDLRALSAEAGGHARHLASVQHLRTSPPAIPKGEDHSASHDGQAHIGCPLCLALHAADGVLAVAAAELPLPSFRAEAGVASNTRPAPGQPRTAAYSPRAPPSLSV